MQIPWTQRAAYVAAVATLALASSAFAGEPASDMQSEMSALKARINELEKKQNENWLTEERASQIKAIVNDCIADAKSRGNFLDSELQAGYKDGFFIQTADGNNKLTLGGFIQARYTFANQNATDGRTLTRTGTTGAISDPGNESAVEVRRARVSFGGYIFKDAFFKLEGDFYGGSGGSFTVTDAFAGYVITDMFKVRAGSFKVPFAKAELTSDTVMEFMERSEALLPFDPVRALGVSLYGDIIADTLSYEINMNDGSKSNTLRQADTFSSTANLDNRMAFYGRMQWAGAGKLSEFAEEADMRKDTSPFIWMIGAAGGYESQNSSTDAFPAPQTTTTNTGLSTNNASGFAAASNLNGDLFRGTIDFTAKWQGWAFNAAGYFQQINQRSTISALTDTSGFQHGYYAQLGYMIIPKKLELVGRVNFLLSEDGPNIGEYYSLGANYYIFGNNAKIQTDITYTPEAAYTDAASSQIINTQDLIYRLQFQVKF